VKRSILRDVAQRVSENKNASVNWTTRSVDQISISHEELFDCRTDTATLQRKSLKVKVQITVSFPPVDSKNDLRPLGRNTMPTMEQQVLTKYSAFTSL
jgi:hypothetical protein